MSARVDYIQRHGLRMERIYLGPKEDVHSIYADVYMTKSLGETFAITAGGYGLDRPMGEKGSSSEHEQPDILLIQNRMFKPSKKEIKEALNKFIADYKKTKWGHSQ